MASPTAHFWLGGGGRSSPQLRAPPRSGLPSLRYSKQITIIKTSSLRIFCLRSPPSRNPLPLSFLISVVSLPLRHKVRKFGSALIRNPYRLIEKCHESDATPAYAGDVVFAPKPARAHTKSSLKQILAKHANYTILRVWTYGKSPNF